MQNSEISWTTNTFNPWTGCVNISPACDLCYAEVLDRRDLRKLGETHWGKDAPRHIASENTWRQPLTWNRRVTRTGVREMVFCGSMMDVMERRADLNPPRERLFKIIEETPMLDWQLVTKRPHEFIKYLPKAWLDQPRPNVWLITTVESAEYLWRIEEMLKVPAVVYAVSCEPLLSALTLPNELMSMGRKAWVITGGESGNRKTVRKPNVEWFRDLRDQCISAGVPFHFKQWGAYNSDLVKIGKKKAGFELDGREWKEFPTPEF